MLIKLLEPKMYGLRQACSCGRTNPGPDKTQSLLGSSGLSSPASPEEPARPKTGVSPAARTKKEATRLV